MPHYISLLNWTDQGIKSVKESPKRADAAMALASKLGAKMQIFYTMGEYDLVSVTEAPNDDVVMQVLLELGKLGNIRTKTLKAWSLAEATKVVSKLQQGLAGQRNLRDHDDAPHLGMRLTVIVERSGLGE